MTTLDECVSLAFNVKDLKDPLSCAGKEKAERTWPTLGRNPLTGIVSFLWSNTTLRSMEKNADVLQFSQSVNLNWSVRIDSNAEMHANKVENYVPSCSGYAPNICQPPSHIHTYNSLLLELCIFFISLLVINLIQCSLYTPIDEKANDTQYSTSETNGRLAPNMTYSSPKETWQSCYITCLHRL